MKTLIQIQFTNRTSGRLQYKQHNMSNPSKPSLRTRLGSSSGHRTSGIMAILLTLVASISYANTSVVTNSPCFSQGPIVYVWADQTLLASQQTGSKNKPFGTLAQADAANARTIVIMYANAPLDQGISLNDGEALIGLPNAYGDYPVIQNTSSTSHGGNAVVVQGGSVCIDRIHFDNTWASGINYDNAKNLTVLNSLVTRYNQGEVLVDMPPPYVSQELRKIYVGGIHAETLKSGTTKITDVEIRDNHIGAGILEIPFNGANRIFTVANSDFTRIIQSPRTADNSTMPFANAILTMPVGELTRQDVYIADSTFHDFLEPLISADPVWVNNNIPILHFPQDGSESNIVVENCHFKNISANGTDLSIDIALASTDLTPVGTLPSPGKTKLTSIVRNNVFEENGLFLEKPYLVGAVGMILEAGGAIHEAKAYNNAFNNMISAFNLYSEGTAEDSYIISKNVASNMRRSFVTIFPAEFYDFTGAPSMQTMVNITDNNVTGLVRGGIILSTKFHDLDHDPSLNGIPYQSLTVNLERNCFTGRPGLAPILSSRYLLTEPSSGDQPGNVTITARNNNFLQFSLDVLDVLVNDTPLNNGGVQYDLQKNYWGGNTNTLDLNPVGGDGIVDINISNPLSAPISCYGQ